MEQDRLTEQQQRLLHKSMLFCVISWLAVCYGCTPQNGIFAAECVLASEYRRYGASTEISLQANAPMPFIMKNGSSVNLLNEIQGLLMKAFVPPYLQSGGF